MRYKSSARLTDWMKTEINFTNCILVKDNKNRNCYVSPVSRPRQQSHQSKPSVKKKCLCLCFVNLTSIVPTLLSHFGISSIASSASFHLYAIIEVHDTDNSRSHACDKLYVSSVVLFVSILLNLSVVDGSL